MASAFNVMWVMSKEIGESFLALAMNLCLCKTEYESCLSFLLKKKRK